MKGSVEVFSARNSLGLRTEEGSGGFEAAWGILVPSS